MKQFIDPLLEWFAVNREPHFFREQRNPYRVWVSEVALQQTRMAAALPLLKRFLDTFPTVAALAAAREQQVVAAWAGLGYYNRARNLQKGARYLIEYHQGEVPRAYEEILKIPSVGPYTAAAIASICFSVPILAVDGNVRRVLARWLLYQDEISSADFARKMTEVEPLLLSAVDNPGEFNEALMEFGQKICAPRPLCRVCFLKNFCAAHAHGKANLLPVRKPPRPREELEWTVYYIEQKGRVLVQKTESFPFLKNMIILPSKVRYLQSDKEIKSFEENLFCNETLLAGGKINHTIMHYKITGRVFSASLRQQSAPPGYEYMDRDTVQQHLNSSLMQKFITLINDDGGLFSQPGLP